MKGQAGQEAQAAGQGWGALGQLWLAAVAAEDGEKMKFLKLAAEVLKLCQEGAGKAAPEAAITITWQGGEENGPARALPGG